ncbi:MAG: hypothetical protein KBS96_01440 [Lachnospiraceae bacterium]|nr:hypothetical protein [Candidatus Colinaster scatohippi]
MKCIKCGADYGSELTKCPYCGEVNVSALQYSNVLQGYNDEYKKVEETLTDKGSSKALKYITIAMIFVYILVFSITCLVVSNINKVVTGKSSAVKNSSAQKNNEKLLEEYMEKGEYARLLRLVDDTDLSMNADELTGFEYYAEYRDSVQETIFPYVNFFSSVMYTLDDLDAGNDYRSLTEYDITTIQIFYMAPDSELKQELQTEIEGYLKNLYRLTDEEIAELRESDYYNPFELEGTTNFEEITKERMVEYFGK